MKKDFGTKAWLYPMPVLVIGTYGEDGTPDAMNAAWGGIALEDRIAVCVDDSHKTTANALARRAFTVHVADAAHLAACDAAGAQELRDVEFGFDVGLQAREVPVVAQDARETAAGGGVWGEQIRRQSAVGGLAGEEPFEGKAVVEGEELAEALGEFLVADEGGVVGGDASVGEPAFHAGSAGFEAFLSVDELLEADCRGVEGRFEVGEAGTEAQAHDQRAGTGLDVGREFGGGGRTAQGGAFGEFFA